MSYLQKFADRSHKKNWICVCKRKNSNEDLVCGFCRSPRPEKVKRNEPKIRSTRTEFMGRWYQSAKECDYAKELEFRKMAGDIVEWTPQYKIEIVVEGVKICNYFCDFLVIMPDGGRQYHEVKGFSTDTFKLKWRILMAVKDNIDPGADWIIIK